MSLETYRAAARRARQGGILDARSNLQGNSSPEQIDEADLAESLARRLSNAAVQGVAAVCGASSCSETAFHVRTPSSET